MTPEQAPPPEAISTGIPAIDNVIAVIGALVVLASTLAAIMPKHWPLTQFLARWSSDVKGVLKPAPKDDKLPGKTDLDRGQPRELDR